MQVRETTCLGYILIPFHAASDHQVFFPRLAQTQGILARILSAAGISVPSSCELCVWPSRKIRAQNGGWRRDWPSLMSLQLEQPKRTITMFKTCYF